MKSLILIIALSLGFLIPVTSRADTTQDYYCYCTALAGETCTCDVGQHYARNTYTARLHCLDDGFMVFQNIHTTTGVTHTAFYKGIDKDGRVTITNDDPIAGKKYFELWIECSGGNL